MNLRKYGEKPYKVAVIHGGPGAAGSMKPICEELSKFCSVLEPLQTEMSVQGQINELKKILEQNIYEPIVLIGHSWGAMLSYMFASKYSNLIKKLFSYQAGRLKKNTTKI